MKQPPGIWRSELILDWQFRSFAMGRTSLILLALWVSCCCCCLVGVQCQDSPIFSPRFYTGGHLTSPDSRQLIEQQQVHVEQFYSTGRGRSIVEVDESFEFDNDRLRNAYIALQAWKKVIYSDPSNITGSWVGPDVCDYKGVFCEPAMDDPCIDTVAGIDLNHADLAGFLPEELGLLTDLALFHINTNRFCGVVPLSFGNLKILFELDLSNNRFVGGFPEIVFSLPVLHYLDIRFNDFEGSLPSSLFSAKLDAIFVNDNRFEQGIPPNLGSSPASVVVLANNKFSGCVPPSIGNMGATLNEILFINNQLTGCLNPDIGELQNLTVFDVSFNQLSGTLPETIGELDNLEQLDVADNMFTGEIPSEICALPKLQNFTYSDNYFTGEAPNCLALPSRGVPIDDRGNCIPGRPSQKSEKQCDAFLAHPKSCDQFGCWPPSPPPPPPS
eukprot:c17253_g1_i1 orf=896-2224(+)